VGLLRSVKNCVTTFHHTFDGGPLHSFEWVRIDDGATYIEPTCLRRELVFTCKPYPLACAASLYSLANRTSSKRQRVGPDRRRGNAHRTHLLARRACIHLQNVPTCLRRELILHRWEWGTHSGRNTMAEVDFNDGDPIAYFITWTTYGSWLPGDERGWWRKGGKLQSTNMLIQSMAADDMKEQAFRLNSEQRRVVEETITRHCEIRSWVLHAVNVRSNHVHVVVTAPGYAPETVRDQLKAWCSRRVKATRSSRKRFWTEGASCRWINREEQLEAAIAYVRDAQDR